MKYSSRRGPNRSERCPYLIIVSSDAEENSLFRVMAYNSGETREDGRWLLSVIYEERSSLLDLTLSKKNGLHYYR